MCNFSPMPKGKTSLLDQMWSSYYWTVRSWPGEIKICFNSKRNQTYKSWKSGKEDSHGVLDLIWMSLLFWIPKQFKVFLFSFFLFLILFFPFSFFFLLYFLVLITTGQLFSKFTSSKYNVVIPKSFKNCIMWIRIILSPWPFCTLLDFREVKCF